MSNRVVLNRMKFIDVMVEGSELEECGDPQYGFILYDDYEYICNSGLSKWELLLPDEKFLPLVIDRYFEDGMDGILRVAESDGISIDGNHYDDDWVVWAMDISDR